MQDSGALCKPKHKSSKHDVVSDKHIAEMAREIHNCKYLAFNLGLTKPESTEIQMDNMGNYRMQKVDCLHMWRNKFGDEASYKRLLQAAQDSNEVMLITYLLGLPGGIGEELKEDLSSQKTLRKLGKVIRG